MSKNDWNSIDITGLPCVVCGKPATDRHHSLYSRDHSKKAKQTGLMNHLNDEINCGPTCHECNVSRKADNAWELFFDYAVLTHGIERVLTWVNNFPEYYKDLKGSRWGELKIKVLVKKVMYDYSEAWEKLANM